jgi:hypothetical protein
MVAASATHDNPMAAHSDAIMKTTPARIGKSPCPRR